MCRDEQPFVPTLPFAPRSDTSRVSARQSQRTAARDCQRVYAHIESCDNGATCDEVVVALNMPTQTVVARINDLCKMRWIRDSGERRRTRRNRPARVYVPRPTSDRVEHPGRSARASPARFYILGLTDAGTFEPVGPWPTGTSRDDQLDVYDFAISLLLDVTPEGEMMVTGRINR